MYDVFDNFSEKSVTAAKVTFKTKIIGKEAETLNVLAHGNYK